MIKRRSLYSLFFLLFTTSVFYQDFIGAVYFGEIGRVFSFFLLPILIPFCLSHFSVMNGEAFKKISKYFKIFSILYFCISIISSFFFYIKTNSFYFLNENIFIKNIKVYLYFLIVFIHFCSFYILFKKLPLEDKKYINSLAVIAILFIIINTTEFLNMPHSFPYLHFEPFYNRIRLLTAESSWSVGTFYILILLLFTSRSKKLITLGVIFSLIYSLTSDSKSFIISVSLVFILGLFRKKKIKPTHLITVLIITIIIIYSLFPLLVSMLESDIKEYTSVITRSTKLLTSLKISITFPLGSGGTFYIHLLEGYRETTNQIVHYLGQGNKNEILNLGNSKFGDSNISAGSFFCELIVMFGVCGYYFNFIFFRYLYRLSSTNYISTVVFFAFLILNIFTYSISNRWEWSILLAYLACNNDLKRLQNE